MNYSTINYNRQDFICREVKNKEYPDFTSTVAPLRLSKLILRNGEPINGEALIVDEGICYYATPEEMKLSDSKLHDLIYS